MCESCECTCANSNVSSFALHCVSTFLIFPFEDFKGFFLRMGRCPKIMNFKV